MFISLVLLVIVLIILLSRKSNYWRKRNIVEVDGVLRNFVFGKRTLAEIYREIYDNHPNENYVGLFHGSKPVLIVRQLEDIKAVLASDFANFYKRGLTTNRNEPLTENLLFIDDFEKWKAIKGYMTPTFTNLKLKNLFHVIDRWAKNSVTKLENSPEPKNNMHTEFFNFTVEFYVSWIFGIDLNVTKSVATHFSYIAKNCFCPNVNTKMKFLLGNSFPKLYKFLDIKTFAQYEHFLINTVKQILENRRQKFGSYGDFMDFCVNLQKKRLTNIETKLFPTDELIAAQAFLLFIAATDPTANVMHFTLLELASNPNVLNHLHEEIDNVFFKSNGELTFEIINDMTYLEMVLNESMRKYPPMGRIQRVCTKNTVLPYGNLMVKENETVVIPVFAIHRDERIFPNAHTFDPERFSPENKDKIPKYAYLPFGEGKRMCPGFRMAKLVIKVGLAHLLRKFTLEEQPSIEENFDSNFITLQMSKAKYSLLPRNIRAF